MSPAKYLTLKIEELDDRGNGVANFQGRKIELPLTIPGETVRIPLSPLDNRTGRSFKNHEVSLPSPDRVEPPCPYFGECGGCQLQHMKVERQIEEKRRWMLRWFNFLPPEKVRPILSSPRAWNYRRRIQLHVGRRGEVGFFMAKGHQVIDVKNCLIAEDALNRKIPEIRVLASQVLASEHRPTLLSYELTLTAGEKVEIRKENDERSFLQVNEAANQILQGLLNNAFATLHPQCVLELFAGSGNLTFALAPPVSHWVAVESNEAAIQEAKEIAPKECRHVQWVQAEAAVVLKSEIKRKSNYDLILMDPPREGALDCIDSLVKLKPNFLFYVSCNPRSLSRDLKLLLKGGYEVEWLQPIDFFPQTMQLETVVFLTGCVKNS